MKQIVILAALCASSVTPAFAEPERYLVFAVENRGIPGAPKDTLVVVPDARIALPRFIKACGGMPGRQEVRPEGYVFQMVKRRSPATTKCLRSGSERGIYLAPAKEHGF